MCEEVPSLADLALDQTLKNWEVGKAFQVEESLNCSVANAFLERLPSPNEDNIACIAQYVEHDHYWKRISSNLRGHKESGEHGLSHKRLYFERQLQSILTIRDAGSREVMIDRIGDYIHTVKLSGPKVPLPIDVVCPKLPNLMNIHLKRAPLLIPCIPKVIASCSLLTTLTLTESRITDDDAALILEKMSESPTLIHLDLSHNKLSCKGAEAIATSLIAPPESILSCLDLSGNSVSSAGASSLGTALVTNDSLLSLTLRMNDIRDDGGRHLFEGLMQNSTLRHVNVSANKLGAASASALLQVLDRKPCDCGLESMVLTSNPFPEADILRLDKFETAISIDVRTSNEPNKTDNASLASEMPCSK